MPLVHAQPLRREPIKYHEEEEDSDDDSDEADFLAARREKSLAVDALDLMGSDPSQLKKSTSSTSPQQNNVSGGWQQAFGPLSSNRMKHLEDELDEIQQPSLFLAAQSSICMGTKNDRTERTDIRPNGFDRKKKAMSMTTRMRPVTRKAGVFECPCRPHIALSDIRSVLESEYFAVITKEHGSLLGFQVPVNSGHRRVVYNIMIIAEERQQGCRLSLRRNVADLFNNNVSNEDFDIFCTDLFDRLMLVRQVVRPYYM